MNIDQLNKYYKPKSISTHISQKPHHRSNLTDLDLPNNSIVKPSTNYTYNHISETKKADDFKEFYDKLYAKYRKISAETDELIHENEKNKEIQKISEPDHIQKKMILSRLKKYRAIANNEKPPFSAYLNSGFQGKAVEEKEKDSVHPKQPMRVRKFRVLC